MLNNQALEQHYQNADKLMLMINIGLTLYALALANWYSTWAEALLIGGGTIAALCAIYSLAKGQLVCRIAMAAGFMVLTALHIHQAQGMIEMHFGVFALLAILLYYRDWVPVVAAAAVIAVHHLGFFALQSQGANVYVLSTTENGLWVIFLHAGYVVVETAVLILFARNLHREAVQSLELMQVTTAILADDIIDLRLRTSGSTELLQRFDGYTADVESLAQEVNQYANQLRNESGQLAEVTDKMRQATATQQSETDMIATAIEEMTAATREISSNASYAANASDEVSSSAQRATTVSQDTQDAVASLAQQVANAVGTITELNTQTANIGSVLDVIRGIAEQTNLLALNAAIEAARAGDQGRGFAVVADEVRTLAQRTQQSTQEIDNMIETLQHGSQSAVSVIESSQHQADECVQNTRESLQLMEQVTTAIGEINQMNSAIAVAANQQSSVVEDVSRNVANILDASSQTSEDAQRAAESASTMEHVAKSLQSSSARFRTSAG